MSLLRSAVPLLAMVVPACALLPSTSQQVPQEALVDAPPESLWPRLLEVYGDLGLQMEVSAEERRVWSSSLQAVWSFLATADGKGYLRCTLPGRPDALAVTAGHGQQSPRIHPVPRGRADPMVTVTLSTTLEPAGEGTRLKTRVSGTAASMGTPEPRPEVHCASTGRLERHVHTALSQHRPAT